MSSKARPARMKSSPLQLPIWSGRWIAFADGLPLAAFFHLRPAGHPDRPSGSLSTIASRALGLVEPSLRHRQASAAVLVAELGSRLHPLARLRVLVSFPAANGDAPIAVWYSVHPIVPLVGAMMNPGSVCESVPAPPGRCKPSGSSELQIKLNTCIRCI